MASAYFLSKGGAAVTLLEKGRTGEQATGASAGMLAPIAEAKRPGPFLDLVVAALMDYESAVRDVENASGISTGYNIRSILRVAFSTEDEQKFANAIPMYEMANLPYHRLNGDQMREEEPALGGEVRSGILSPNEGQVIPRQLVQAYRAAAVANGAHIVEGTEVSEILVSDNRARGVRTLEGTIEAHTVLIAAGAWSSRFGTALGREIPVYPVRGQIVALRGLPVQIKHVLYSYSGYAVPWPDGRLLLGATQEEAGYDPRTTVSGVMQVLTGARHLVPGIDHAEIDEVWAGLRPGCADAVPLLGPVASVPNVWLATGHFRNGVLLGPYTARLISESILAGKPDPVLAPFLPDRQTLDS